MGNSLKKLKKSHRLTSRVTNPSSGMSGAKSLSSVSGRDGQESVLKDLSKSQDDLTQEVNSSSRISRAKSSSTLLGSDGGGFVSDSIFKGGQSKSQLHLDYVHREIINKIAEDIEENQWRLLGRELGLHSNYLDELDKDQFVYKYGRKERNIRMVEKWMQEKNPGEEMVGHLSAALRSVKRTDIADSICQIAGVWNKEQETRIYDVHHRIEEKQREVGENVELPQPPWTEKILPLEELYVDLEMFETRKDQEESEGTSMPLEEMFNRVKGEEPVRILIEGGPGFGKTTLCLKLFNDWARKREYMGRQFKMVFMFQLRYLRDEDSIEGMLMSECETAGVGGVVGMNCIEAFHTETLLILDGFDELSDEGKKKFLPLLKKKQFPSMFVVVTSRRGMFQMGKMKKETQPAGILRSTDEDVNKSHFWNKRVVIKGVAEEQIHTFMKKYLNQDYEELETKIVSVTKGEMNEVLQCPLFLILLSIMLEEKTLDKINSKTALYKEFFNFITRRNLIREKKIKLEDEMDLFNPSSEHPVNESLIKFGRFSVHHLCENNLMFKQEDILKHCEDETILHLGFLVKLTKLHPRRRDDFYQPIHKSFLEFVAAFAAWNLFNTDEDQFKREIERMAEKGLKPSNDSLFYVFLGGFMNSRAHVLFQCLTPYSLYFNIENICFTNILLEIQDFDSFYPLFEPLLEPFIPSFYSIDGDKGLSRQYFQHSAHALILKYVSDRNMINYLCWDTSFGFNFTEQLYFNQIQIYLTREIVKDLEKENKNSIKCKNLVCRFSEEFKTENWKHFVSLLDSIESETFNFGFYHTKREINSSMLSLVHEELIEGRWKQKNIDRLMFNMNEFDDPRSLSLLVDLVKKNRIKQGIYLKINGSHGRRRNELNEMKRETEDLFNAVMESKSIQEFCVNNLDSNFSPLFDFHRENKMKWKTFGFSNYLTLLNSSEKKNEKYSVEELLVYSLDEEMDLNLIRNMEGIKWLLCRLNCFNSLVDKKWSGLEEIEELQLVEIEEELLPMKPRLFSQLTNLQVLSLDVYSIETLPRDSRDSFVNLFSSLQLRICELIDIPSVEMFSYFTELLIEGLKKKEEDKSSSVGGNEPTVESKEGNKVQLQELVIDFDEDVEVELIQLKKFKGIEWIQSMLQLHRLGRCCWSNINLNIKPDEFFSLFPWNEKFRVSREVGGMDPNNPRSDQFFYRWFSTYEIFCVRFVDD